VGLGPLGSALPSRHHVSEFGVVLFICFAGNKEHDVVDESRFQFVGVRGGLNKVGIVEAIESRGWGITLIKSVGDFKRFGFIVIKGEDGLLSCHVTCDPVCVLYRDLAAADVVHHACDDGIGKSSRNVKEKARHNKTLPPLFKCPVDSKHERVCGRLTWPPSEMVGQKELVSFRHVHNVFRDDR
jgi:hypothetical protein